MTHESITLTQHWLGTRPYVLIEAALDAEGELALDVSVGGGATEDRGALPFMMLANLPADENPITDVLRALQAEPEISPTTIARVAKELGVPL